MLWKKYRWMVDAMFGNGDCSVQNCLSKHHLAHAVRQCLTLARVAKRDTLQVARILLAFVQKGGLELESGSVILALLQCACRVETVVAACRDAVRCRVAVGLDRGGFAAWLDPCR